MVWPINCGIILVAHRARSVTLRSSLKISGSGPWLFSVFVWKTWRTAIEWRADAAVYAILACITVYAILFFPAILAVDLHGLLGCRAVDFTLSNAEEQICALMSSGDVGMG